MCDLEPFSEIRSHLSPNNILAFMRLHSDTLSPFSSHKEHELSLTHQTIKAMHEAT